jgi:hypothetical protein
VTLVDAWQATLEQEHAAVYGYGLVGGKLGPNSVPARTGLELHRARRDQCVQELIALSQTPIASEPAYRPATPITNASDAKALAASIEQDCSAQYVELAAQLDLETREFGAQWLRISAVQQTQWSNTIPALPGLML